MIKPILVMAALCVICVVPTAHAEMGKNYDKIILATNPDGTQIVKWQSAPERIIDHYDILGNPVYSNYKLFQNSTIIQLETANSGSIIWNKAACSYDLYKSGLISENRTAQIKNISWDVKGKLSSATNWSSVNTINNAACSTSVLSDTNSVTITGSKVNGVGTFQVELKYVAGRGIKETMKAFNNNPAWNNHNIGFAESFNVPRVIHFGGNTFDLANYDNTTLNRNWIGNNTKKLITLSNDIMYDFGLGWSNLNDIKINWDGTKAKLTLNYLYPNGIVPYQQWITIDPTFTGTPSSEGRVIGAAGGVSVNCSPNWAGGDALDYINKDQGGAAGGICTAPYFNFDISSIPNTSAVTAAQIEYDVTGLGGTTPTNCDVKYLGFTGANNEATYDALTQDIGSVTDVKQNDATCKTLGDGKIIVFNTGGYAALIQADIVGDNVASLGMFFTDPLRDAANQQVQIRSADMILSITYVTSKADRVTTLTATTVSTTDIDLAWTQPNLNGGTLLGYRINYTTPCGDPTTILVNNTGTPAVAYTVSPLTSATCYSFRVGAWTQLGNNGTGNIANATTLTFNQANFTIGGFNFNANNPLIFPIRYERIDNGSQSRVNVTFTNTISLACDLRYTYAGTNHTYHTISSIPVSASENEASFLFTNSSNDIVTFKCWNQIGNQSANYVLTQTDFLLLQQIHDFRNGTYGTQGMIGAFDFVSLVIVIIAMIGLNRNNEAVAGFFCLVAITVLTFFEIIHWEIALVSALAVIILLAVSATRKD